MWMRATRWVVAALIGSAMTTIGCARVPAPAEPQRAPQPIVADEIVHAFDTSVGTRLLDRLELDHFLRERDIHVEVFDGIVRLTGSVFTPLEKHRVSEIARSVPGVIDVSNDLAVRPPD